MYIHISYPYSATPEAIQLVLVHVSVFYELGLRFDRGAVLDRLGCTVGHQFHSESRRARLAVIWKEWLDEVPVLYVCVNVRMCVHVSSHELSDYMAKAAL